MPDFTARVAKRLSRELHPGERILKALSAQPPGSLTRGINETGGDVGRGMMRGRSHKQQHDQAGMAGAIPPRNVFLTLTDRRLLIHTMSGLGRLGDLAGEFSPDQIDSVDLEPGRFGSGTLLVTFADRTSVDFLIASRQRPAEFTAAWEEVGGAPPAS